MRHLAFAALVACSPMHFVRGVPNLELVDPGIYRSGQIATAEGWAYIKQLAGGRKVHVIKLNYAAEGSDAGAILAGFDVVYLPIQPEGDQDVFDDLRGIR